MQDSIFTKIVRGEIPCHRIYEDDLTLAFLDTHPMQPGHTLVIPKKQVEFVWDLPETDYQAVMSTAKKVANRLQACFPNKSRVALLIEGLDVAHAHLKLFPFNTDEEFHNKPDMQREPDHTALAAMAKSLAF